MVHSFCENLKIQNGRQGAPKRPTGSGMPHARANWESGKIPLVSSVAILAQLVSPSVALPAKLVLSLMLLLSMMMIMLLFSLLFYPRNLPFKVWSKLGQWYMKCCFCCCCYCYFFLMLLMFMGLEFTLIFCRFGFTRFGL